MFWLPRCYLEVQQTHSGTACSRRKKLHLIACRATAAMLPLDQGSAQIASFLLDVRPPQAEATLLYVCSTAGGLHMGQTTRSLAELREVSAEVKQVC